MNKKLISVIIATRNEEKNVERIINSIKEQSYPSDLIEIILVDNASKDKTREIAHSLIENVYNLTDEIGLDKVKNFRGAQVNFGATKAKGEILFFPDADMTFDKNLFKEFSDNIANSKKDALYVPEIVCGKGLFGKIRNFERSFYNKTCIDGIRVISKNFFEKIGGFDVKNIVFGYDDWDITKMIVEAGAKVDITHACLYHHEEWLDIKTYLQKKSKYSVDAEDYINKWGRQDNDIKKQFGLKYRYCGVFIEDGKWKKMIKHPLLTFGVMSLRVMIGIIYIFSNR